MSSTPPGSDRRGRWVAIVSGVLSVLIAVAYLAMVTVLDRAGPLQPPPPEALGVVAVGAPAAASAVPPPG